MSPRVPSTLAVSAPGDLYVFRGVPAGLVKILLVLLGLQGALFVLFLSRLARGSFQLVVADYSLHVPAHSSTGLFSCPRRKFPPSWTSLIKIFVISGLLQRLG